jgi:hypothetical protein
VIALTLGWARQTTGLGLAKAKQAVEAMEG